MKKLAFLVLFVCGSTMSFVGCGEAAPENPPSEEETSSHEAAGEEAASSADPKKK